MTRVYANIKEAVEYIRSKSNIQPRVGIVLGSGLSRVAEDTEDAVVIPYSEIPHFYGTSVEGHEGEMVIGNFSGVPCVFLKGRFHVYEGYPMEDVVFPTRTVCALGIQSYLLTNAAGGINTRYKPGDMMIIEDHLNLMGDNPLKGPNLTELGPRFPDMSEAYSRRLIEILKTAAADQSLEVREGVYAGVLGPTYETPAEIRMLRTLGADAVGMSTVPEAIAANHLGVQVAGISCISNLAAGIATHRLTHQEVMDNAAELSERLRKLLLKAIPNFSELTGGGSQS